MKTLLLLRHAKSDWDAPYGEDHERPLNPRGVRSARRVGRFLKQAELIPDAVVTSTAVRARTTVELAAEAGDWGCPIERTREIYDSTPARVLEVIRAHNDAASTLLCAGHEPTTSQLAGRLVGGGRIHVVTASLLRIDFHVEQWRQIEEGRGTLIFSIPPRLLGKAGME